MTRSVPRRRRARLRLELHPKGASKFLFAPLAGFAKYPQRCRLSERADTPAQSVRATTPAKIGSKGKTNVTLSAEFLFPGIGIHGRVHRRRLQREISSPDISYLDPVRSRVTEAQLAGKIDVGCH